jgi:hypothetical protein
MVDEVKLGRCDLDSSMGTLFIPSIPPTPLDLSLPPALNTPSSTPEAPASSKASRLVSER